MVALIAQLGSVAHLAIVKHVECSEHGELVEVADAAGASRSLDLLGAKTLSVRADQILTHGHDHCSIAAFRRERIRPGSSVSAPVLATDARMAVLVTERDAPPPAIALLKLAPKNSPPA